MKKALVLSLAVILGLGLFASAQVLSGEWYSELTISGFPAPINIDYESTLDVSYTVGGWVFASATTLGNAGWTAQSFSADGSLGAFTFGSTLKFDPSVPSFTSWNVTAGLSLGGMELGADGTLADKDLTLILTGSGSTGVVDIDIAATFGGDDNDICDLPWSDITIDVGFPFCCADVNAEIYFTCDGFEYVEFCVTDIALPNFPWLTLDACVLFETQTKTLTLTPNFDFGADVCFDLYYDIDTSGNLVIGDITFTGIGLECEIGGVSFTGISYWGGGTKPGILAGTNYWEAYQIATTDAGCCGPFDFDLTVYFEDAHNNLFDVAEFDANMSLQVSDQFTFGMGLDYDVTAGLTEMVVWFDVVW